MPKKEGNGEFITDYHRLNQHMVRKPHTFPIIIKIMNQLEVFHYSTALYLNMGYYNIRLFHKVGT